MIITIKCNFHCCIHSITKKVNTQQSMNHKQWEPTVSVPTFSCKTYHKITLFFQEMFNHKAIWSYHLWYFGVNIFAIHYFHKNSRYTCNMLVGRQTLVHCMDHITECRVVHVDNHMGQSKITDYITCVFRSCRNSRSCPSHSKEGNFCNFWSYRWRQFFITSIL